MTTDKQFEDKTRSLGYCIAILILWWAAYSAFLVGFVIAAQSTPIDCVR